MIRSSEAWEAAGRSGPLIPPESRGARLAHDSLHVNWIGISIALHYDDSMDSTVERVYSSKEGVISTYSDDVPSAN